MKPVKDDKKENKYWQTSTKKILAVTLVFGIIVVGFTLITGQAAYGNVVGPLFNDSKVPLVQYKGTPEGINAANGSSILMFNVTDKNGPNQATITEIILSNGTSHIVLSSQNISKDVFSIKDAAYHYHTDVTTSPYNGILIPLGDEATIHMNLTSSTNMELHGKYKVTLVVPTQKAAFATADVTF